jgi:long-chain acyl-CoA synthetase
VYGTCDDIAWLFYTSGTTGRPKGAMLTHANLQAMTLGYRSNVETVAADDAYVYAAPISHGAGLYTFAYTASAARHVIPRSGGFDAAEVLDLAAELNKLCMFAAPTMVNRLVDEAARRGVGGGGIKSIVYGGGPMYVADIARALEVMGPRFAQIYGQGETPMTITCMTRSEVAAAGRYRDERRLASVGRSQSVVEVKVVDADGQACRAETPGAIIVRGPTVMKGYWGDEAATASALRRNWLHTGDIGSFDAQGFLTLRDRSKDVIISGGANIYPREVEEVLLEHPGIPEASVIGAPDPEWGEKVVAFIVATGDRNNGGPSDAQLDELCLSRVARFKRPKEYVPRWLAEEPQRQDPQDPLARALRTDGRSGGLRPTPCGSAFGVHWFVACVTHSHADGRNQNADPPPCTFGRGPVLSQQDQSGRFVCR